MPLQIFLQNNLFISKKAIVLKYLMKYGFKIKIIYKMDVCIYLVFLIKYNKSIVSFRRKLTVY